MSFKKWNDNQEIPASMPLMDRYIEHWHSGKKPLKGVTMLLIQHQLGNQVPQAKALLELGVDPRQLFWLDIPYTANATVRQHLVDELGIPDQNISVNKFTLLQPYANYQRSRTQELYKIFLANPPRQLVVLDDGAYFVEAMATFKKQLINVAIVEQTTRGIIKINNNAALKQLASTVPVIDVAKSTAKRTLEPPFIGYSVCQALMQKIQSGFLLDKNKNCLVLGYGAIGKQVAKSLLTFGFSKENIFIYDKSRSLVNEFIAEGYRYWQRDYNTKFSLVVGCSGRSSFVVGDHVYLNEGALLASASSGAVELSREEFIELADSHPHDDIYLETDNLNMNNIHSDLTVNLVHTKAHFLNGGFPVNFSGQVNCVPSHYIQPTQVMMVEAAVQASRSRKKGFSTLRKPFSEWLRREFILELGEEAHLVGGSK